MSSIILTINTQGTWERFREQLHPNNPALEAFQAPLQGVPSGIAGKGWLQASLALINKAIAQQAEVVSFINIATMVGLVLLALCALPQLHRSANGRAEPHHTP